MNNFSKQLIYNRKRKNLTQRQLGDILGVSDKIISKWENNELCPSIENVKKLAIVFEIDMQELITGTKICKEKIEKQRISFSKFSVLVEIVFYSILLATIFWYAIKYKGADYIEIYDINSNKVSMVNNRVGWLYISILIVINYIISSMYFFKIHLYVPYNKPMQIIKLSDYIYDKQLFNYCYKRYGEFIACAKFIICSNLIVSIIFLCIKQSKPIWFIIMSSALQIALLIGVILIYLKIIRIKIDNII